MKHSKFFHYQEMLFDIFIIVSYLIYILLGIGFLSTYPTFLTYMNNIIRIYICFFILDRFNPFRNIKCTSLDRKVVFSSGLLILTTFILNEHTINNVKNYLKYKL
jgi:hypothetical protein